ncbi:hypothetical protein VTL71DRAFT_10353 [Oculimacula yallundae]|uniref:F-box domain-containing protein n=1 Tax=Oculimacula yallundae TaxID=86028 RepID=A0ABR4CSR8_9HELO
MAPTIETLPLIILERICEFLENGSATRPSLLAFSLVSKSCYVASSSQRLSQIELKIPLLQDLQSFLTQWNDILAGGQHRHVRRLKISLLEIETAESKEFDSRTGRGSREQKQLQEEEGDEWSVRHYFYMHEFCRPDREEGSSGGGGRRYCIEDRESALWAALGDFIGLFQGLKDLVWAAGQSVPPPVLSIAAERGTRFHMHHFALPSLIQDREPTPISAEDYALCTHPSICSISVTVGSFLSGGRLTYTQEAVMQMVTGLAPNLAHLYVEPGPPAPGELDPGLDESLRLGKPDWKGFFPEQTTSKQELEGVAAQSSSSSRGKLQTLIFRIDVPDEIEYWARHTDFSYLRSLVMSWEYGSGTSLARMASQGDLQSLKRLKLFCINDGESDPLQEAAVNLLFSSLNPLERLEASGYISPTTFSIITHQHGPGLRALKIGPEFGWGSDGQSLLVTFSAPVLEALAAQSPHLTHLDIPINRTRGNKDEVAIYRALSRFPHLEHVALRIEYRVTPEYASWDHEREGPHPLDSAEGQPSNIPMMYLKEAFSNSAIDEKLARSIFELTAGDGRSTLRYLRLRTFRKMDDPISDSFFDSALRWLNRSFVCKRDSQKPNGIAIQELDLRGTAAGEDQWIKMANSPDEDLWYGEENYVTAFKALWPPKKKEWWRDWESLPLDLGEVEADDGRLS